MKWALYPGLDLLTRRRYRVLPSFFRSGPIDTLDAGCGNGALAYAACRLGNRVVGVTNNPGEVEKARSLFRGIGVPDDRLRFELLDIYDLPSLGATFDQIVCSETLEHIRGDRVVLAHFFDVLRPGGVLHLCCPFAPHPLNHLGRVDGPEDGGHVRDGYTLATYEDLLRPLGFEIVASHGIGGSFLVALDARIRGIRNRFGDAAALPVFLATWPLQAFDVVDPPTPLSLYVQAVKPS